MMGPPRGSKGLTNSLISFEFWLVSLPRHYDCRCSVAVLIVRRLLNFVAEGID